MDKLLNYSILSPTSIIDWILIRDDSNGRLLARSYIFELLYNTLLKVSSRVRQLARGPTIGTVGEDERDEYQRCLDGARTDYKELFAIIERQLISIAKGTTDGTLDDGPVSHEDQTMITRWAELWLRALRRKFVVEVALVKELIQLRADRKQAESVNERAVENDALPGKQ